MGQLAIVDLPAIVSKDLNGVMELEQRRKRLFGYAAEEVIGKSIMILIPPDRADEETGSGKASARRKIDHYETVRRRKDGAGRNLIDGTSG